MDPKDWPADPELLALIPPALALQHRVIPLGEDGDELCLLAGERMMSEDATREKTATLAWQLGRPVRLKTLDDCPDLGLGRFNEILDLYGDEKAFPEPDEQPPAIVTALLVDDNDRSSAETKRRLESDRLRVVCAGSVDEAEWILTQSPWCVDVVLLPDRMNARGRARKRLLQVCSLPVVTPEEAARKMQPQERKGARRAFQGDGPVAVNLLF